MRLPRNPVPDRRAQKTQNFLREALVSLIHEKNYDAIVVKEILDRANVGRSTFYTHFRDKDELLVSGIQDMLRTVQSTKLPSPAKRYDKDYLVQSSDLRVPRSAPARRRGQDRDEGPSHPS